MAGQVKVLQVERVIPSLIEVVRIEPPLANLEFDDKHRRPGEEDRIDAAADSWDVELEKHAPVDAGERRLEYCDLADPGVSLRGFHGKGTPLRQRPQDRLSSLSDEVVHARRVVGGRH